jgi:hypothetical protein
MPVAQLVILIVSVYAAAGFLFGVAFVTAGVGRVDETARVSGAGFRLIILPGSAALWPVLLVKWIRARKKA